MKPMLRLALVKSTAGVAAEQSKTWNGMVEEGINRRQAGRVT
jgi:hypothetical protein